MAKSFNLGYAYHTDICISFILRTFYKMLSLKNLVVKWGAHLATLLSLFSIKFKGEIFEYQIIFAQKKVPVKVVRPPFHNKNIVSLNVNDGKDFIADYELWKNLAQT